MLENGQKSALAKATKTVKSLRRNDLTVAAGEGFEPSQTESESTHTQIKNHLFATDLQSKFIFVLQFCAD
jgi:hypothetical protein